MYKDELKKLIDEKNDLKEKHLITKKILNTDKYNVKSTMTGTGKNKIFKNQLEEIDLTPENYLNLVKIVAEHRKYNPDLLKIADDGIHKLEYNNVKFGRVGYNDKIIYSWLEKLKEVPEGTTKKKYINYRKRAREIMKKTKNKYSPASLSFNLIW